ncbi:MAG: hypothetical protein WAT71_03875 [Ignavibacteria bacterium]
MKKLLFILPAALICFILMTGQNSTEENPRWNIDPRTSVTYSNGEYTNPPSTEIGIKQFTFAPRTIITPIGVMVASPNVRVHPSSGNQQCETDIVRHPTNPNIMFAAAQNIINSNNFMNVGVYVTTDGGVTWDGKDTMNAPNLNDQRGDPAPIIDKNGNFIYGHLLSVSNFGSLTGMGANYSTNNGATWSSTFTIMSDANVDKNMAGTDGSPSSPYYGNSYMAWTVFSGSAGNGRVSRTTNGGVSWDPVITLNSTPAGHFAQGHDVAVAPNGNVFVCWTAGSSTSPFTEDYVGIAKSTNGGVTYTATENAYDVNGSRSASFNGWAIRTNGFPRIDIDKSGGARNGWIYIVDGQINLAPAGTDADVILRRSSDNGTTWSAGIRVNQDGLNNGKVQFFPVVNVDDAGGVNVVYYDNRNFPSVGDSCSVYMSRSIDGGTTWTDMEVADHHFKPKNLPGINTMGDYIGVTSGNGKVWPVWMDDKAGTGTQFNIWTTSVVINNYPLNPFNLTSPAAGTKITTSPGNLTNNNFTWDTASSTASYKWIFGSPLASSRQISLTSGGNSFNVTSGDLDALLAGLGVNYGDSLVGQWDVWAYRNNITNDSLKAGNGTRAITLKRGIPATITTSADSLVAYLPIGPNNTVKNLNVGNIGQFDLNWTITESSVVLDNARTENMFSAEILKQIENMPKGAADIYHGPEVTDGMGGPDAGGYTWIDSDEPGGPAYNWVDISSVGTQITTWTNGTGDDGSANVALPFSFGYYGNNYTNLKICTNGWVSFDVASTNTAYSNVALPSASEPNNMLCAFWDDLDVRTSGQVFYYNDVVNNRFIVEYKDVPHYSSGGPYTFEVIIYSDGRIYFQYQNIGTVNNSNTVGIENSTGTIASQMVFNNIYVHNLLAIKLEKGIAWVDESPIAGTVNPLSNQNVNVTFNSTGLSAGVYTGVLKVNSNDPSTPVKNVSVKLIVGQTAPAQITLINEGYLNLSNKLNIKDTVRVYLRNTSPPYAIVDSAKGVIDSVNFTGSFLFANASSGTYYIQVKSRNCIETWSKSGGEAYNSGFSLVYNFTTASSQAYGSNLKQLNSKHCIYSGDVTQDGLIDLSDLQNVDNSAYNFATGYVTDDLTGDYVVDISDLTITDNNAFNFVTKSVPPGAVPELTKPIIRENAAKQTVLDNSKYYKNLLPGF